MPSRCSGGQVMDQYLRERAIEFGATPVNGLVNEIEVPTTADVSTGLEAG